MTLKKMRKEEVGVQSDCAVNSAPVAGCKELVMAKRPPQIILTNGR